MYFRPFIGIISPTAMGQPGQKGLSQDAGLHVPLLRGGGVDPSKIYIWVVATQIFVYVHPYLDVSENSGTPKSSKLIRFSIINHPFWGNPIFGNTHLGKIPMLTNIFQMGWNHQPDIYDMVILFASFERDFWWLLVDEIPRLVVSKTATPVFTNSCLGTIPIRPCTKMTIS